MMSRMDVAIANHHAMNDSLLDQFSYEWDVSSSASSPSPEFLDGDNNSYKERKLTERDFGNGDSTDDSLCFSPVHSSNYVGPNDGDNRQLFWESPRGSPSLNTKQHSSNFHHGRYSTGIYSTDDDENESNASQASSPQNQYPAEQFCSQSSDQMTAAVTSKECKSLWTDDLLNANILEDKLMEIKDDEIIFVPGNTDVRSGRNSKEPSERSNGNKVTNKNSLRRKSPAMNKVLIAKQWNSSCRVDNSIAKRKPVSIFNGDESITSQVKPKVVKTEEDFITSLDARSLNEKITSLDSTTVNEKIDSSNVIDRWTNATRRNSNIDKWPINNRNQMTTDKTCRSRWNKIKRNPSIVAEKDGIEDGKSNSNINRSRPTAVKDGRANTRWKSVKKSFEMGSNCADSSDSATCSDTDKGTEVKFEHSDKYSNENKKTAADKNSRRRSSLQISKSNESKNMGHGISKNFHGSSTSLNVSINNSRRNSVNSLQGSRCSSRNEQNLHSLSSSRSNSSLSNKSSQPSQGKKADGNDSKGFSWNPYFVAKKGAAPKEKFQRSCETVKKNCKKNSSNRKSLQNVVDDLKSSCDGQNFDEKERSDDAVGELTVANIRYRERSSNKDNHSCRSDGLSGSASSVSSSGISPGASFERDSAIGSMSSLRSKNSLDRDGFSSSIKSLDNWDGSKVSLNKTENGTIKHKKKRSVKTKPGFASLIDVREDTSDGNYRESLKGSNMSLNGMNKYSDVRNSCNDLNRGLPRNKRNSCIEVNGTLPRVTRNSYNGISGKLPKVSGNSWHDLGKLLPKSSRNSCHDLSKYLPKSTRSSCNDLSAGLPRGARNSCNDLNTNLPRGARNSSNDLNRLRSPRNSCTDLSGGLTRNPRNSCSDLSLGLPRSARNSVSDFSRGMPRRKSSHNDLSVGLPRSARSSCSDLSRGLSKTTRSSNDLSVKGLSRSARNSCSDLSRCLPGGARNNCNDLSKYLPRSARGSCNDLSGGMLDRARGRFHDLTGGLPRNVRNSCNDLSGGLPRSARNSCTDLSGSLPRNGINSINDLSRGLPRSARNSCNDLSVGLPRSARNSCTDLSESLPRNGINSINDHSRGMPRSVRNSCNDLSRGMPRSVRNSCNDLTRGMPRSIRNSCNDLTRGMPRSIRDSCNDLSRGMPRSVRNSCNDLSRGLPRSARNSCNDLSKGHPRSIMSSCNDLSRGRPRSNNGSFAKEYSGESLSLDHSWNSLPKLNRGWESIKQCIVDKTNKWQLKHNSSTLTNTDLMETKPSHGWDNVRHRIMKTDWKKGSQQAVDFMVGGGEGESEWLSTKDVGRNLSEGYDALHARTQRSQSSGHARAPKFSELFNAADNLRKGRNKMSYDSDEDAKHKEKRSKSAGSSSKPRKGKKSNKEDCIKQRKSLQSAIYKSLQNGNNSETEDEDSLQEAHESGLGSSFDDSSEDSASIQAQGENKVPPQKVYAAISNYLCSFEQVESDDDSFNKEADVFRPEDLMLLTDNDDDITWDDIMGCYETSPVHKGASKKAEGKDANSILQPELSSPRREFVLDRRHEEESDQLLGDKFDCFSDTRLEQELDKFLGIRFGSDWQEMSDQENEPVDSDPNVSSENSSTRHQNKTHESEVEAESTKPEEVGFTNDAALRDVNTLASSMTVSTANQQEKKKCTSIQRSRESAGAVRGLMSRSKNVSVDDTDDNVGEVIEQVQNVVSERPRGHVMEKVEQTKDVVGERPKPRGLTLEMVRQAKDLVAGRPKPRGLTLEMVRQAKDMAAERSQGLTAKSEQVKNMNAATEQIKNVAAESPQHISAEAVEQKIDVVAEGPHGLVDIAVENQRGRSLTKEDRTCSQSSERSISCSGNVRNFLLSQPCALAHFGQSSVDHVECECRDKHIHVLADGSCDTEVTPSQPEQFKPKNKKKKKSKKFTKSKSEEENSKPKSMLESLWSMFCTTPVTVEGIAPDSESHDTDPEPLPPPIPPHAVDPDIMTADEAQRLLSAKESQGLLSDEEAKEVVLLLSPPEGDSSKVLPPPVPPHHSDGHPSVPPHYDIPPAVPPHYSDVAPPVPPHFGPSEDEFDTRVASHFDPTLASPLSPEDEPSEADSSEASGDACQVSRVKEVLVEDGVHYLEDGHFWVEVPGLPEDDDEEDNDPTLPFHPHTKLSFSKDPIQVFSTYSVTEYDRKNDEVDPVAASAEYELEKRVEKMDLFPVEIIKGEGGLGLSIIGMGVGADAGVEKLGIFVKTITSGGATEQDGRIQVNDQIIEVDGKSLVGVTQVFAASVLKNTSGRVHFLIGREKDPENSEVALLIKQSLQADREREQRRRALGGPDYDPLTGHGLFDPLSSPSEENSRSEEASAPQNYSSYLEGGSSPTSPDAVSPPIESFDLEGDTSDTSPDNDVSVLKLKLKEIQYRNAVGEAEITKLKMTLLEMEKIVTENVQYSSQLNEAHHKVAELDDKLQSKLTEVSTYQDMLEQSQGQYIILEKKYYKAKKIIKEYQGRERDFLHREEYHITQLEEKDSHYNALVKALKDRVISLEEELKNAQKKAGLPVQVPVDPSVQPAYLDLQQSAQSALAKQPPRKPSLCTLDPEISDTETSDNGASEGDKANTVERKLPVKEELDEAVPPHELLDVSASRAKGELATRGGLANRHLPSLKKTTSMSSAGSQEHSLDDSSLDDDLPEAQKHAAVDAIQDTQQEQGSRREVQSDVSQRSEREASPSKRSPTSLMEDVRQAVLQADVSLGKKPVISAPVNLSSTAHVVSTGQMAQQVNSPNRSQSGFYSVGGRDSIRETNAGSQSPKLGRSSIHASPLSGVSANPSGVVLLSQRPIDSSLPTQKLGPGIDGSSGDLSSGPASLGSGDEGSGASLGSQTSLSHMHPPTDRSKRSHMWQTAQVIDWTKEQVSQWLIVQGLECCVSRFQEVGMTGPRLLNLDVRDLKSLGLPADEKSKLKRKVKELRLAVEKERKQVEKEKKERERLQKKAEKLAEKAERKKK